MDAIKKSDVRMHVENDEAGFFNFTCYRDLNVLNYKNLKIEGN